MYAGFHGLRVMPQSRECVKPADENSGVAVRMWGTPPAATMRSTTGWVSAATVPRRSSDPPSESSPAMGCSSLRATGSPSSGRGSPPPRPA